MHTIYSGVRYTAWLAGDFHAGQFDLAELGLSLVTLRHVTFGPSIPNVQKTGVKPAPFARAARLHFYRRADQSGLFRAVALNKR